MPSEVQAGLKAYDCMDAGTRATQEASAAFIGVNEHSLPLFIGYFKLIFNNV
jgi:hypothetical protein